MVVTISAEIQLSQEGYNRVGIVERPEQTAQLNTLTPILDTNKLDEKRDFRKTESLLSTPLLLSS